MKRHLGFFASLIAFIFIIEGVIFLLSFFQSYQAGFRGAAFISLFIALVHFIIAGGLIVRKRWTPHLGIFFQLYIIVNFILNNREALSSPTLLPSALTVLSVAAFITVSLFILKDQFRQR